MNRRVLIGVAACLVIAGIAAAWRWNKTPTGPFGPAGPGYVIVSGNIEAHESQLSFSNVQAPITELPFDEGANVSQGEMLARVDDRLYQRQVEIDRANMQIAQAQVAVNESSLAAAQHNVASDEADFAEKQRDYLRNQEALKTNAVSVQSRDLAATALKQSAATLARDQAIIQQARANIALAQANLVAAEAKLHLDEVTLSYTTLSAPFSGTVSVREAELGELAGPGVVIFTLDDLDHPWLRAYVNEQDIGKVRLGEAVELATDTYPSKIYHGHISFISPEAEFTPKTVQTFAERVTLVYRIRIDIANPLHELLPGMPADARIALLPPGS
jgi:HlyD family secretion protein